MGLIEQKDWLIEAYSYNPFAPFPHGEIVNLVFYLNVPIKPGLFKRKAKPTYFIKRIDLSRIITIEGTLDFLKVKTEDEIFYFGNNVEIVNYQDFNMKMDNRFFRNTSFCQINWRESKIRVDGIYSDQIFIPCPSKDYLAVTLNHSDDYRHLIVLKVANSNSRIESETAERKALILANPYAKPEEAPTIKAVEVFLSLTLY